MPALEHLRHEGCRLILGIRDVMDEPALLVPEWERKGATQALARYYDEIWVYGLEEVYRPLAALDLPAEIEPRITYTGYLRRGLPREPALTRYPKLMKQPFILSRREAAATATTSSTGSSPPTRPIRPSRCPPFSCSGPSSTARAAGPSWSGSPDIPSSRRFRSTPRSSC
jgi:hypothetical protein